MPTSSHTRFSIERLSLLVALIAGLVLACQPSAPAKLTVFVSCDSRGYLEPCGCRADQAGGLPGRARAVREVSQSRRLVFDVGNMTAGTREYDLLKMQYMLEGMALIGYDAVNLGAKEAELDIDALRGVLSKSDLPFVSANVFSRSDRKPVTERYRLVSKSGSTIGVIGVTSIEPEDTGPGVQVRPVMETLAEVVPEVRAKCDFLVVLAFTNQDKIAEIASKFHEVDCILGGDVPQSSGGVQTINRAQAFNVTDKGKVIGRIDLVRDESGFVVSSSVAIRIVADKKTPPEDIGELLGRFKNELRERRYELASVEGMERIDASDGTANEFVGDKACLTCHGSAHEVWSNANHSQAFETLKHEKSEYDPDCLRCHTVGYGLSSGFIDETKTPHLANVQCESCHGRGKDHVETQDKQALKPVTPSTCVKCHDQENSENFNYATFWPKIAH